MIFRMDQKKILKPTALKRPNNKPQIKVKTFGVLIELINFIFCLLLLPPNQKCYYFSITHNLLFPSRYMDELKAALIKVQITQNSLDRVKHMTEMRVRRTKRETQCQIADFKLSHVTLRFYWLRMRPIRNQELYIIQELRITVIHNEHLTKYRAQEYRSVQSNHTFF